MNSKKFMKRFLPFVVSLVIISLFFTACGKKPSKKPASDNNSTSTQTVSKDEKRQDTLVITGLAWGENMTFNPMGSNPHFVLGNGVEFMYETLFMYNMLTNEMEPLIGQSFDWTDDYTLKVEINDKAHWNDGKPLTAEDVAYTYMLGKKYKKLQWSSLMKNFIDEVTVESPTTVIIKCNQEKFNRLAVLDSLQSLYIVPKHYWTEVEKEVGEDEDKLMSYRKCDEKPVSSGAYKYESYKNDILTLVRDDNYWGKELFGKLAAPKYIVHPKSSNTTGDAALTKGEVDVSQCYIENVDKLMQKNPQVKTYSKEKPFYVSGALASAIINLTAKGLDNFEVRKALAMSIDYTKLCNDYAGAAEMAVPGLTIPNREFESKYIDESSISDLKWKPDPEAAKQLLDSIGATPGSDGIRVLPDGTKLSFKFECVQGWTDYMKMITVVSQSAKKVGIEIKPTFLDYSTWDSNKKKGLFDITLDSPSPSLQPSQPWARMDFVLGSSGYAEVGQLAYSNFGRFKNNRADEILLNIPKIKDDAELKNLYTELDKIYLENIPVIPLVAKPWQFYNISESVWKGFPTKENNPKNIPPLGGAFVKALYELHH